MATQGRFKQNSHTDCHHTVRDPSAIVVSQSAPFFSDFAVKKRKKTAFLLLRFRSIVLISLKFKRAEMNWTPSPFLAFIWRSLRSPNRVFRDSCTCFCSAKMSSFSLFPVALSSSVPLSHCWLLLWPNQRKFAVYCSSFTPKKATLPA